MDKNKTVFVDIDTQNDFLDIQGTLYISESSGIKRNLARLVKFAIDKNITIISTMDTHFENDPEFNIFKPHCIANSWGWEKIPETTYNKFQSIEFQENKNLKLKSNRFILKKPRLSPFSNYNTMILLKLLKKEDFVVFGVATDFCVRESVLGLLNAHFKVYLVEDAIKGINESNSKTALEEMAENGACFVKTREIISKLEQK